MLRNTEEVRQSQLEDAIYEMAASLFEDQEAMNMCSRLKELYSNGFRRNYAQFFPIIIDIGKEDNHYNLEYLSNNLNCLKDLVEKDYVEKRNEFTILYRPLKKLSDHINLEIGRYNYYSANERQLEDLKECHKRLVNDLAISTEGLTAAKDKLSSIQAELVSVLSIFAAIVLAVSGSISFVGKTLSEPHNETVFKTVLLIIICGFVVFNLIFIMMYVVGKITGRNIFAKCKTEDCTCKNGEPDCCWPNRLRKRLPYVFWFNVLLAILLLADIACWWRNLVYWKLPL